MDAKLSLTCEEMDEQEIQQMTYELMRSLNQNTDLEVEMPEESGGSGTKGDAITFGTIFMTALTTGTVTAFLNVVKSFIERKSSLEFEIEGKDGKKIKIKGENLKKSQYDLTIKMVEEFCGTK